MYFMPIHWRRTDLVPQHALQPVLARTTHVDGQRGSTSLHHHHGLGEELLRQAHHHLGSTPCTVTHLWMELFTMDSPCCFLCHLVMSLTLYWDTESCYYCIIVYYCTHPNCYLSCKKVTNRTSFHRWMELFSLCFLGLYPIHTSIISR